MGGAIFAIIFFVALIAIAVYMKSKNLSSGKTVKRNADFMEYAEMFTLKAVSGEEMNNYVKAAFKDDIESKKAFKLGGSSSHYTFDVGFGKYGFSAVLICTDKTDDKMTYKFSFTEWKTSYGRPASAENANMFLTKIEKMFTSIDANTQISTVKNDVKKSGLL